MTTSLRARPDLPAGLAPSGVVDRTVDRMLDYAVDRTLDRAVGRVGRPASVRFTVRQLYYEFGRVVLPPGLGSPGFAHAPRRFGVIGPPVPVPYRMFSAAVERRGRDRIPGLLPEHWPTGDGRALEPDVLAYGLARLLVCQDVPTARMLLANDIHLETGCPVLAEADLTARPEAAESMAAAVAAAGQATVFVLHDASQAGLETPGRVRASLAATAAATALGPDFGAGVTVIAVGLRPSDARALHLARCRTAELPAGTSGTSAPASRLAASRPAASRVAARVASPQPEWQHGLEDWEARWLARGRAVELAAVPPGRLLRGVHRALCGQPRARWAPPDLRAARELGFLTWPTA